MRVVVSQSDLYDGLRTVARAAAARNVIPALSGVRLSAAPGTLNLCATDLELTISHTVPADTTEADTVVAPGRHLLELVRRLPPGPVRLETLSGGSALRVGWGDSVASVQTFAPEHFPAPERPGPDQHALSLSSGALRRLLRGTGFATGHDESRPWFTGVFLTVKGSHAAAMATDAAIVAYCETTVHNPGDLAFSVILPGRSLQELAQVLPDGQDEPCLLLPRHHLLQVEAGPTVLTTRLLEGQYPDFRRLLPSAYPSQARIPRRELLAACERALLLSDQGSVRFEAAAGALQLTARAPEVGDIADRLPAAMTGAPFAVPLNARYVVEGLRSMESADVLLEYAGARSAVRFRADSTTPSYFAVLPLLSF